MQLLLPPSPIPVYGAYLQYGRVRLSDSPLNVTLTAGASDTVYCGQATGPVPISIEWYNPQNQLVSKDTNEEVNQGLAAGGSYGIALLIFLSYQPSQGGKYECKVDLPGNYTEKLLAFIGECYTLCDYIIKSVNGTHSSAAYNCYVLDRQCAL